MSRSPGLFNRLRSVPPNDPVVALIVANVITIVLAVVGGWSLVTILVIYWIQCLIIGLFTGITILTYPGAGTGDTDPQVPSPTRRRARPDPERYSRRSINATFAVLFGVAYGIPLLYAGDTLLHYAGMSWSDLLSMPELILPCSAFFLNHLYSFMVYRHRDLVGRFTIGHLILEPYLRIIPMQVVVIFFALAYLITALTDLNPNPVVVPLFLAFKTCVDVWSHKWKHAAQSLDTRKAPGN